MSAPLKVIVHGAAGRMGQELLALCAGSDQFELAGAVVRPGSTSLGAEALPGSGLTYTASLGAGDVVIDFSLPQAVASLAEQCVSMALPLLSGTTGLGDAEHQALAQASGHVPVLWAANTAIGVHVTAALVRQAAATLPNADIEIVETHHREKLDAPSGTALFLGQAAAAGRGKTLEDCRVDGRAGPSSSRKAGEIGFASVRGGSVAGEHRVMLLWEDERIEIGHAATNRSIFASGALSVASWLAQQPAGLYTMADWIDATQSD